MPVAVEPETGSVAVWRRHNHRFRAAISAPSSRHRPRHAQHGAPDTEAVLPRTLKFLCLALGALLVADIAMLLVDIVTIPETDPLTRNFIAGANSGAIAITLLILATLVAFARRMRNAMAWLHAFVIANAVVLIAGSLLFDALPQEPSLLEAMELARSAAEVLVCIALALVLRRRESRTWFAGSMGE